MAPNHPRTTDSLIAELAKRVERLQNALARGPILPSYASTGLPANPPTGLEVLVTDYGLRAWFNGTAWIYPPQRLTKTVLAAPTSSVRLPGAGNVPPVFTNLRLVISAKSTGTGSTGYDAAGLQFNGVTSASYNWNSYWTTQGATTMNAIGGTSTTNMQCAEIWNSFWGSAGRGIATIDIPNYSDTASLKSFSGQSTAVDGGTVGILQTYGGSMTGSTAAITSLTVLMGVGQFVAGSEFSLYGS